MESTVHKHNLSIFFVLFTSVRIQTCFACHHKRKTYLVFRDDSVAKVEARVSAELPSESEGFSFFKFVSLLVTSTNEQGDNHERKAPFYKSYIVRLAPLAFIPFAWTFFPMIFAFLGFFFFALVFIVISYILD